ncbi:hypothetical protein [Granulicella sibirica]|uniref:Uncharacterized protein n=1 Tax=Granulicella sibirica TaxID=2479048 RepID=A0A4Q0SYQ2_9BACT|nr:hypothetical protein [Granulicella sibirica]RXH56393.1 hypothetical protein GRAN_3250 [Granulicella sibirica]
MRSSFIASLRLILTGILALVTAGSQSCFADPIAWVNPYIGTGSGPSATAA